jgi:hypothetical protein
MTGDCIQQLPQYTVRVEYYNNVSGAVQHPQNNFRAMATGLEQEAYLCKTRTNARHLVSHADNTLATRWSG